METNLIILIPPKQTKIKYINTYTLFYQAFSSILLVSLYLFKLGISSNITGWKP